MLFDRLVIGQIMSVNPASSVRGPKHVVRKGKTPVLSSEDTCILLDSIKVSEIVKAEDGTAVLDGTPRSRSHCTDDLHVCPRRRRGQDEGERLLNSAASQFRIAANGGPEQKAAA